MKRLAWAVGGLALGALALATIGSNAEPVQAQQGGRPAIGTRVSSTSIEATECAVMLIDQAILASERPGIIAELEFKEGDEVTIGKEVVRLKDGPAVAATITARHKASNDINVRYQKKAWELAVKELDIAKEANRTLPGTVPKLEIDKLVLAAQRGQLAHDQAEFEQAANRHLLTEAEEQLKSYAVVAPFSGTVSKVHSHLGEAVTQGAPILEIISTARMKVEGYVEIPESYIVKKFDKVEVSIVIAGANLAIEDEVKEGEIVFVSPTIEPVYKKVKVVAYVDNKDGILKEGLRATMHIKPRQANTAARSIRRR